MPKHPDFEKIYKKYVAQYGEKKGKEVYYAWLNKHKYDDTKPFPKKESFPFVENYSFKYAVPFEVTESHIDKEKNERLLRGTLLVATTSRNNVTYESEEINNALFNGRPFDENTELTLSLNHTDDVTDNVGLWKPIREDGKIMYKAKVFNTGKHPYVTDMVDKGLIKYVSVEAIAKRVIDEGDSIRAVGLDITGMGLVKTPGIAEASAAIAEAFKSEDEDKKWIQKAEPKKGAFDQWCKDHGFKGVCQACIDKAAKAGGHAAKMALFATNMPNSPYTYPKKENLTGDKMTEEETQKTEPQEEKKEEPKTESSESAIDKLVEKLDALISESNKTKELEEKIAELEKKLTETKTKGNVTEDAPKPLYRMVKEKNRYAPGKVDIYAEDVCY